MEEFSLVSHLPPLTFSTPFLFCDSILSCLKGCSKLKQPVCDDDNDDINIRDDDDDGDDDISNNKLVSLFNCISTFVGYLMREPSL